jgi:gamma-glutamylcyclotransferase (GGCT)/AIG2-like uncharacterized protein YtfP
MRRIRLFVYGTLKRGGVGAARLAGAIFEGVATTATGFALYDLVEYPALVAMLEAGRVEGEVYQVTLDQLAELDSYEGYPDLFHRELVPLADGSQAQAYLMPARAVAGRPRIASGVWP